MSISFQVNAPHMRTHCRDANKNTWMDIDGTAGVASGAKET